jgi:uncharacterized protein (TIGR03437 family)
VTITRLSLAVALAQAAVAQAPQITSAGVVNAASYAQPIAPGSLVSIFGANLATASTSAVGQPLLTHLAGTSVAVNGVKAPLLFVSPTQINLEIPSATSFCYVCSDFELASFIVTTAAGSSAAVQVPVSMGAPAAFTVDGSGCGQVSALNVTSAGSASQNSPSNSAAPGDYISLFGTAFGPVYGPPVDGTAATGLTVLQSEPDVTVGFIGANTPGTAYITPAYAGLAPGLVGVDQMNFQIPQGTLEGCSVPVVLFGAVTSPPVALSIHTGRGQCSNPPVQSYGQIELIKTIASGTSADGETDAFIATFPSGPGMSPPQPLASALASGYVARVSPPSAIKVPGLSRTCAVPGYSDLSAGPITVSSLVTSAVAEPVIQVGGAAYQQTLPVGVIAPRTYQISASGGPVQFRGSIAVGSPIQVQTATLAPGTVVSSSVPFTVNWTGGDPGTLVTIYIVSGTGLAALADYAQADASAGAVTFDPMCTGNPQPMGNGVFCSFGLPLASLEVVVDVSNTLPFTAEGITGGVQATWDYRYVFGGLTLGS